MPNLADLTDYSQVNQPDKEAAIAIRPVTETPTADADTSVGSVAQRIADRLLGLHGQERYQLWPEKVVREALSAPHDVMSGDVPQYQVDPVTGDVHTSPQMIEKAQAVSALAGTGGLAGTEEGAVLNATPSLRPALKYKDKLYKGKPGQEHQDVIPPHLYPEFQQMAMNGEDISHYNFGFVNDKGHFLNREEALKYGIDTGLIDPQAGKYGALTSTLMADSSKPGTAIEAVAQTAQPFYSAVEHQVNAIPQAKMTGEQWLGTLANKPGVKPEELDWTGLKDYLTENKGQTLTKQQVQDYVAANKVELKEINKGKPIDDMNKEIEWRMQNEGMTREQATDYVNKSFSGDTKYHSYQLPGGENYREMLLTLPRKDTNLKNKWSDLTDTEKARIIKDHKLFMEDMKGDQFFENDPSMKPSHDPKSWYEEVIAPNLPDVQKQKVDMGNTYKSSHWDEPNILAHVRMNDRTIEGKKSLHLEEIQSDWHQQGRDKGYRPENEKKLADLISKRDSMLSEVQEKMLSPLNDRYKEIYKELPKIQEEINQLGRSDVGVPDAPFKKSWHELALKRMLREAAEKGYDRLSWTPGEAQAARYDLSKQIDKLGYDPRTGHLQGFKDGGMKVLDNKVPKDKLADFVGKEAADKLLNKPTKVLGNGYHTLENADLKIGGEGMKGFYDQIIPKALEKIGKEHGVKVQYNAGKVGRTLEEELKNRGLSMKSFNELSLSQRNKILEKVDAGKPVHYIDIPQSLKDRAMQKGFPLFSGGYMFTPVAGNPFEEQK